MGLPSRGEARRVLAVLRELHAHTYGPEPEVDLDEIFKATKHARLYTKIRYLLEYLDLKYILPGGARRRNPRLEEMTLEEMAAGEESEVPVKKDEETGRIL